MSSAQSYDAVVVGAGVIGLASAYALQQSGASVCVVEQHLPGSGQSTRTGGGIRLAHGSAINVALTKLSLPTWQNFAARFGVDPHFHNTGHLFLSSNTVDSQKEYCGTAHNLDAATVQAKWPQLSGCNFATASHCEIGGWLNHFSVIQGYQQTLQRSGVVFASGLRVEGLLMRGTPKQVCGVRTQREDIPATLVINAAGAGAGKVAAYAGLSIPFCSRRHELLIVRADINGPTALPWLIDVERQVHMRPEGVGRALVGGFLGKDEIVDPDDYQHGFDKDWADEVRAVAAAAFGLITADAEILDGWAGLYPGTTDYLPVVEHSMSGMITVAGFSGTGLMHAPAIGDIVNLLAQGKVHPGVDISGLSAARFSTPGSAQERSGF